MSNARVVAFASLLLMAFVTPASSQTPADSAKADSLKPKKTSRFGGMLNRAKQVAGNEKVQGAVKGAATNVACNAVPGVAVAAAASGGGPCQNTLMGGLVSKGMKGTAAMVAGGAASTAAAKATGKLGSTTTAAAAGALGSATGKGALSQAAAATAAGMIPKGLGGLMPKGVKGSDAAAIAAQAAAYQAAAMQSASMQAAAMGMMPSGAMPGAAAAASKSPMYDEISSKGHVATQGLVFDAGGQLRPESTPTLAQIASMLEAYPKLKIRIEGHTDNSGVPADNKALSEKRAQAVKAVLVDEYHVKANRIDAQGLGDTRPVASNTTLSGRYNNNRIEIVKM